MRRLGLFGMLVPSEHGGIGIDAISYSIVFEEISRAWMGAAGILGTHSLATLLIARHGTEAQQRRWLRLHIFRTLVRHPALIELVVLAGHYALLAGVLNSLGVQPEGPLPALGEP
jgi:acyl-CoA dehydrogenase-like protein